jgi:hypothetical protein
MLTKKNSSRSKTKQTKQTKTKKAQKTYYTHDNGGRPFTVSITGNTVSIYKLLENDSNDNKPKYTKKPILTYQVQNYFIGNSPKCDMTLFSGGYGSKFDGNSILLHMNDNNYIYIGEKIYSFTSNAEIVKYISPVGNSDVPYPYAIDSNNSLYLMIEYVILGEYNTDKYDNPYDQYYSENKLIKYKGIQEFNLCNHFWNATYAPFSTNEYDRLIALDWDESKNKGKHACKMQMKVNNKMKVLTKKMYVNLINEFGEHMKYSPLVTKTIVERL